LETLDLTVALLMIIICAGAGFVQRVSGFGLGIFVMLFLPYLMPSHTAAAAISCLFSLFTSTSNAIKNRKHISYATVMPMIVAAFVCIPVAVYFSSSVPTRLFQILLGIVLIALSLYFLFFNSRIHIKPTKRNGVIAGALGGTLNGMFSTGGPPAVLYLTHATTDKLAYFASIQFYFAFTNLWSTATRAINGIITWEILLYTAIGLIGCVVGNFFGSKVFDKLDAAKLKTIIYIGMIISGILMIL